MVRSLVRVSAEPLTMSVVDTASSALKILVPEARVTLVATKVPKRLASPPPLLSTTLLVSVLVAALIAKSRVPAFTVTVDPLMLAKVLKTKTRPLLIVMAPMLLVLRAARLRITSLPAVTSPPPPVIAALK